MTTGVRGWNISLIRAIGQSGFRVEEVAHFLGTTEGELFDICRGYEIAGEATRGRLAAITGREERELFP